METVNTYSGMRSIGIDLSTSATGIVVLAESDTDRPHLQMETEIKPPANLTGINRSKFIVGEVMGLIHNWEPDVIVIEGYSLNMKHASSVIPLVELGGLLRFMLHLDGFKWYGPRASKLKQFATGSGNAAKDKVMMMVLKKWGHESASNNIADAYVLAAMGLAKHGKLPATKEQQKVIKDLPIECN